MILIVPTEVEQAISDLKQAVMDTLREAHIRGERFLGPAEISRRARIPADLDDFGKFHFSITTGILRKLIREGKVDRPIRGHYCLRR